MSSNSEQIVQQIQQKFQDLVEYVMGDGSQTRPAYEVELTLFRRLLALGAALLRLFFVHRAAVRPGEPVAAADGTVLKYQGLRPTTYFSAFGKVRFARHYYHAAGHAGVCPLDAALSLPPRCYSDLLRDWTEYGSTNESYGEALQTVERVLGLPLVKLALETSVQEDAPDVDAFYDQKAVPPPAAEGPILVLQADGKGVPMVRAERRLGLRCARKPGAPGSVGGLAVLHVVDGDAGERVVPRPCDGEGAHAIGGQRGHLEGRWSSVYSSSSIIGRAGRPDCRVERRVARGETVRARHKTSLPDGQSATLVIDGGQ